VLYPPLTTIKQDFRLLGKTSVDRLLKTLSGPGGEEQSAVARLTGEKKTTLPPNTQTTSPARWQIP
jgi:DNA-binding LacI/PurR family transcriptional regulator